MLLYLIQAILSFFIFVFAGRLFFSFIKYEFKNNFTKHFLELFAGFYGLVSLFAIYKTNGISISSIFLIWIIIWLITTKKIKTKNFSFTLKIDKKSTFELILVLSFFVILNYIKFYTISNSTPIVISWDALSDVTRAIFMNYRGVENTNTNFIQLPQGSLPYHYFEAWSVAFLASLFKGNFWLTQGIVFQPIILTIIYAGCRSLLGTLISNKIAIFLTLSIFVSSGIVNEYILNINFFEWVIPLRNNIIDEPWWTRLSVLFPPIILTIFLLKNHKWNHATFSILLIPFLSVTPAIPTICATFGVIFLSFFIQDNNKRKLFFLICIPVIAAIFYQGFYLIYKDNSEFISLPKISDILKELSSIAVIKSKVIMIIEKIIQTILLYSPFILIIFIGIWKDKSFLKFKEWKSEYKIISVFIFIITIVSLLMWQALYFLFGSSFFYYYTVIPLLNILVIYSISVIIEKKSKNRKILILSILGVLNLFFVFRSIELHLKTADNTFTNKYDSVFLNKVQTIWKNKIKNPELALGVKIEDHSEIVHPFFNDGINLCGTYIYGIANAPGLISLSRADISEEQLSKTNNAKNFTLNSSFYQYVYNKKLPKNYNLNLLKKKFISDFSIQYGLVSEKGIIPKEFYDIIDEVITDKKSKERFILFKK